MKTSLLLRKIHKWIGLIIGIQILLWFTSGLVMSWFDIDRVRGSHVLSAVEQIQLANFSQALTAFQQHNHEVIQSIETTMWAGEPHLLVNTTVGTYLFDPKQDRIISPLTGSDVEGALLGRLKIKANVLSAVWLDELPGEVRGRTAPLWQVQFDDEENTRIYVSPFTGQVVATRTDTWRLFDFFWMLHIMDYDERSDFNHPLLIGAALLALLVAISGIWLLFYTLGKRKAREKRA